jgi:competence protein ComEA
MQIDPELPEIIKKYFTFSRREYKASLALLFLTLLFWFTPQLWDALVPRLTDPSLIEQKAASFENPRNTQPIASMQNIDPEKSGNETYFKFNPNTCSDSDFKRLGFSLKQIRILRSYLAKAGEIKTKAQFRKIYGIHENQFDQLDPFVELPDKIPQKHELPGSSTPITKKIPVIEINAADSNQLDLLPGIGMGYARRIIKYREALGGYITTTQLLEVYGFRQSLLDSISPYLRVDPSLVKRININTAGVEEMRLHPYIRYKLANAIVNYRLQHGPYQKTEDLLEIVLITDEMYTKVKSYLRVD